MTTSKHSRSISIYITKIYKIYSFDAFTVKKQMRIKHTTSWSRLTGYPQALVAICHHRGHSCSRRLSSGPRGDSANCTGMNKLLCHYYLQHGTSDLCQGGSCSHNLGIVLLCVSYFLRGEEERRRCWRSNTMDSGASFLQNEGHWVSGCRGKQKMVRNFSLTSLLYMHRIKQRICINRKKRSRHLLTELSWGWWLDLC